MNKCSFFSYANERASYREFLTRRPRRFSVKYTRRVARACTPLVVFSKIVPRRNPRNVKLLCMVNAVLFLVVTHKHTFRFRRTLHTAKCKMFPNANTFPLVILETFYTISFIFRFICLFIVGLLYGHGIFK